MFGNVWNNVSECSLAVIANAETFCSRARGGAREFTLGENFMHMRRKWILYNRARPRGRKCVPIDQWYVMGRVGY